jgi:hypothetical protein
MKLVSEYLADALRFERLAEAERNPAARKQILNQAQAYYKLAKMRAINLGQPVPESPQQSPPSPQHDQQPALQQQQVQPKDDGDK